MLCKTPPQPGQVVSIRQALLGPGRRMQPLPTTTANSTFVEREPAFLPHFYHTSPESP
jgi:hypothetical protein